MSENKWSSKTSKLKNFLVTGAIDDEENEEMTEAEDTETMEEPEMEQDAEECLITEEEVIVEDIIVTEEIIIEDIVETDVACEEITVTADVSSLEKEIAELRSMVADLTSQLGTYATSKEQFKEYSAQINKRDTELANKKFVGMLEQLSTMREDFFKLCNGMNAKLDSFSPKDILSSFEAYGVDMENILVDSGVYIGPFQYEKLNTIHQRIVDVIPTDDESMNGMIAERVSDGYEYGGRVLLKEKVKIYRFSENNGKAEEGDE